MDGPEFKTIEEKYTLQPDGVMVRSIECITPQSGKIVVPGETKTRHLVVETGCDVTFCQTGQVVLISGRVVRAIAKDVLAGYVTPLLVGNKEHMIVGEEDVVAIVE